MQTHRITLQQVKARQQALCREHRDDEIAVAAGRLAEAKAVERAVRRASELRWLEMEALLLKSEVLAF
jgi:hypothetical protein